MSLIDGPIPVIVYLLSAITILAILFRRPFRRWLLVYAVTVVVGLTVGFIIAWLISDIWNTFDVVLTFATRLWFSLGVAGVFVAIVSMWRASAKRRVLAGVGVLVFALMAGIGINADIGEFPTVATAFGANAVHSLSHKTSLAGHGAFVEVSPLWKTWVAPSSMPKHGTVGTVTISPKVSHFSPRQAIVYLPPAARVANPPALPVLEMLSGQPGEPRDLIDSGQLPALLDAFAVAHHGLAPIVVMPDQLGSRSANPMCVNSALGNSATYLTTDVPRWIIAHFRVLGAPRFWAIGGFSEGGTCSIQLGAKFPAIYGGILDISGQIAPANGNLPETIARGFHRSVRAYIEAQPTSLLAAGAPFKRTLGVFGVGSADAKYGPDTTQIVAAARAAGMRVVHVVSPGTAHDWHTVEYVFRAGLEPLAKQWGLIR